MACLDAVFTAPSARHWTNWRRRQNSTCSRPYLASNRTDRSLYRIRSVNLLNALVVLWYTTSMERPPVAQRLWGYGRMHATVIDYRHCHRPSINHWLCRAKHAWYWVWHGKSDKKQFTLMFIQPSSRVVVLLNETWLFNGEMQSHVVITEKLIGNSSRRPSTALACHISSLWHSHAICAK